MGPTFNPLTDFVDLVCLGTLLLDCREPHLQTLLCVLYTGVSLVRCSVVHSSMWWEQQTVPSLEGWPCGEAPL